MLMGLLTFFSLGSVTLSTSLLRALRIWEAATEVEVFSKACKMGQPDAKSSEEAAMMICSTRGATKNVIEAACLGYRYSILPIVHPVHRRSTLCSSSSCCSFHLFSE